MKDLTLEEELVVSQIALAASNLGALRNEARIRNTKVDNEKLADEIANRITRFEAEDLRIMMDDTEDRIIEHRRLIVALND